MNVVAGADCRQAQTRVGSLIEAATNILVGYGVALAAQQIVVPLFGIRTTFVQDSIIAAVFTVVSLLRSYALRRLFERVNGRGPVQCAKGAGDRPAKQV